MTASPNRGETIADIIETERGYWRVEHATEKDERVKIFINGAQDYLKSLDPETITLAWLREEYREKIRRKDAEELKDRVLDETARERASYAAAAIKRLGERIKKLDVV